MKALLLNAFGKHPQPSEIQLPSLKDGEVKVEVLAPGVTQRDYYITK